LDGFKSLALRAKRTRKEKFRNQTVIGAWTEAGEAAA
jgi:hypothetical protein